MVRSTAATASAATTAFGLGIAKSHRSSYRSTGFDVLIVVDTSSIVNTKMDYCCTPLFEGVLDASAAAEMAPVMAALGDPVRLRIISMLAAAEDGFACGCDLEAPLDLSQPTVSHHMKVLREAGLIEGIRLGRWVRYKVVPERLAEVRDALTPAGALV